MLRTRSAPAMPPRPDCGLSSREEMTLIVTDQREQRAPPGTGLAVAILCTLAALGGCAAGYGVGALIEGVAERIER